MREAFICDGIRTPIGRYGGALSGVRADDLAAIPLRELLVRNPRLDAECIDDVILGCANQAGEDNRNVARMATLLAGLPQSVSGTTINRLCGSGLDALGFAARAIKAGDGDLLIAGGVESMSRAPFVMGKAASAFSRQAEMFDTTIGWRFVNPLMAQQFGTDSMPETAENVAELLKISREDQDSFALRSQQRTAKAQSSGILAEEIVPVVLKNKKGVVTEIQHDEHLRPETTLEQLRGLKAPFRANGVITAGNASGVNDGAAALIIASEQMAAAQGLTPRARIVAMATAGVEPRLMGLYTQNDIDNWANIVARSLRAAGGSPKDKIHVAYGYGLFTGGLGAHYGAERLGATVIPMSGGQTEKQAQLIRDFQPDMIMVTPSYCLNLIEELERQLGGDASGCSLRVGVFGAEPWTQAMRKEIERRLGITALDIYGLSEVMGPGVAMECLETTDGPTIWEDHFYPEIVNPQDGTPLADGEHGELLFTTLTKEALPVIRYRTRDLTRLLPGTARTMRRMDRISGRSDDMLIIRGVNVFPSQLEEEIVKFEHLSPHYQLEVNRRGHLDSLSVKVELKESSLTLTHEQRCQVCHQLRHRIKSMVGISTDVMIVNCGSIPRSEGKACRVFDLRNIVGA
ncbi:acetyl-CoA C-acyltransferase [Escherichia coli]|nr:acetyl-CoA C-acyltransferase [Escherichia coli]